MNKRERVRRNIEAAENAPKKFNIEATAEIDLSAAEGEEKKRPTFKMTAYSGGAMDVGFGEKVVVDLAGLKAAEPLAILLNHNPAMIVGQSTSVEIGKRAVVSGVFTGDVDDKTDPAGQVVMHARGGFRWPVSIGARINNIRFIGAKESAQVNGKTHKGPLYVVEAATLREVSFVGIGADEKATSSIAASGGKETTMTFEQWLTARGIKSDGLGEDEQEKLQAAYDGLKAAGLLEAEQTKPEPKPKATATEETPAKITASDDIAAYREQMAAEKQRVADIAAACNGKHPSIEAQAVKDGKDVEWVKAQVEIADLRAGRPRAPMVNTGKGAPPINTVLEATAARIGNMGEKSLIANYGEDALTASDRYRRVGLNDFVNLALEANGLPGIPKFASESEWVAASFSTADVSTLLSNVANKVMWDGYQARASIAVRIAKKLTANDFKTHTGVRLTGSTRMDEVGNDGELKHGTLGDESFTYAVKTYGRMFGITRKMRIDDDLGALMEIPAMIGAEAFRTREHLFWTLVLANTGNFFSAGNSNVISGASSALSTTSLSSAVTTLMNQTDTDGNPIDITGRFLVVPPALMGTAQNLFASERVVVTGLSSTSAKALGGDSNIHRNLYEPLASTYLSNAAITGNSTTAWYLFADPMVAAAFGIAYLNGVEGPTIEDAGVAPNVLGRAWRGYMDVGVTQIDKRAAVRSAGA